jgi:hypothetical protein
MFWILWQIYYLFRFTDQRFPWFVIIITSWVFIYAVYKTYSILYPKAYTNGSRFLPSVLARLSMTGLQLQVCIYQYKAQVYFSTTVYIREEF